MKIDLHCHTLKAKKGDGETRNIDAKQFRTIMNDNNVKIAAITNHNVFDACQYNEFVKECGNDLQIWPGIELDVLSRIIDENGKCKTGHVIIISNPSYVEEFSKKVEELINNTAPDKVEISVNQLLEFYSSLKDAIILPHYRKNHSLDLGTIEEIRKSIEDEYRFFYEPSNYRSLGILNNNNYSSLMGSDVRNWSEYSSENISELKLEVDSFEQFIFLAKKDSSVVNSLLNKKTCTEIDISHISSAKSKSKTINKKEIVKFYDDVNVIFGTKGTGKSDVLSRVLAYYKSKNIDYSYYSPSENDDEIKSKLEVTSEERKLSSFQFDNCESEFSKINRWKEGDIVQLKDFKDYQNSKNKNKNKSKLKIITANIYQELNEVKFNNESANLVKIQEIDNTLRELSLSQYLDQCDIEKLNKLMRKLIRNIKKSREDQWVDCESKKAANKSIEILKNSIEKNTETKTKPNKTGLFDFCDKRYSLMLALSKIEKGFEYSFKKDPIYVGELEKGKLLYLTTNYRMYSSKCRTNEFGDNITDLKSAKKLIDKVNNEIYSVNISEHVNELNDFLISHNFKSLDCFLGVKKTFTLSGEVEASEYVPSTGEATMIILQEKLNDRKNIFILDEPEKSLGNTYVNEIIVTKLIELGKMKKTVIVVTHNANIAVRTFPYTSILKVYDNGNYKTYVGNPFVDKLTSTSNPDDTLNWKEESLRVLEGGEKAFEERGEIYGKNDS